MEIEDFYTAKLNTDEKMNTFLRYFSLPKNPTIFLFYVATGSVTATILINTWIVSIVFSLLSLFFMWNCWIGAVEKEKIVERCVFDETSMQAQCLDENIQAAWKELTDDPIGLTDEDRDTIVSMRVSNYWSMTLQQKIRFHYIELLIVTIVYAFVYIVLRCIF